MSLLDLCSYLGLGAVALITLTLLLGMLMALRYSSMRLWPHRRINLFALHRWIAYGALLLMVAHPATLLFLRSPRFSIGQILWPIHSYLQPKLNLAGAFALYLLVIVLGSSLWRLHLSRRLWRNLHWLVYPATVLLLLHSLLTDPELKTGHPDMLDGGKVYLEATVVGLTLLIVFRVAIRRDGLRGGKKELLLSSKLSERTFL